MIDTVGASRRARILLGVITGLLCLAVVWLVVGRERVERLLDKFLERRAVSFEVPASSPPLQFEATYDGDTLTVCNRGALRWNKALVRVNDGYVGALRSIETGRCTEVPRRSLVSQDWKKLPAPRGLRLTKLEVLAAVSGEGYSKLRVDSLK